jgi:transposase-like protein/IS1 family transposase
MIAPACQHQEFKRHGHDRYGNPRFRCKACGKTWIEKGPRPLGQMRLPKNRAVLCLKMLLEGNSIRTAERLTGTNRNTILRLLETVGARAQYFWVKAMRGLPAQNVQADECWGFVAMKEKTRLQKHRNGDCGDAYTFLAIERDTKLILAWHVGRRELEDTEWFSEKLRVATSGRFQLTTDGFKPYCTAIPEAFSGNIDFAQLVKTYGKPRSEPKSEARYSPAEITGIRKREMWGHPDMDQVSTSFVERANLSIRMGVRRMTRLTNGFSKRWENHEAHLAIWFLYYNFCRVHATLKTTPAVAAGLTSQVWSVDRLLDELATLA